MGLYALYPQAERAVERLRAHDFAREQLSVVTQKRVMLAHLSQMDHTGDERRRPTQAGRIPGWALGRLTGLLVGRGATAVPGLGAVLAVGPLAVALDGAAGGLTRELEALEMPREMAAVYHDGLKEGMILIAAHDNEQKPVARRILQETGAQHVYALQQPLVRVTHDDG